MANLLATAFLTLLNECDVPAGFQRWLGENTMTDRSRFLLGAPKCIDTDLISQYGQRFTLGEKIAIRMAYKMCLEAVADVIESRTAVRISLDSAEIPRDDLATLKTFFTAVHGFMLSSKGL